MTLWQRSLWWIVGVLLSAALVYETPNLPLRDYRETRLAETAREMLLNGDWLVPRLNGSPFIDKPPLVPWLVALSFGTFGMGEGAARLPAVLTILWTAAVVGWITRRMFGAGKGIIGAVLFLGAPGSQYYGRMLMVDTVAMALALSATAAFLEGYLRRHRGWYCLGFIFCGLGVMARGPVGLAYPLGALGIFLLWKDRQAWKEVPWMTGGLLVLMVTLPWFVWVAMHYADFLHVTLVRHHIDRLVPRSSHPFIALPRWQILSSFIGFMGPLSLCLPWAVRRGRAQPAGHELLWLLVCLVLGSVLLSTGRNHPYTLSALPPLIILAAGWLGSVTAGEAVPRFRAPALLLDLCGGAILGGVLAMDEILPGLSVLLTDPTTRLVLRMALASVATCFLLGSILLWQGSGALAGVALAAVMLPGTWMLVHVQRQMIPVETRAALAQRVAQEVPPTWPVIIANPADTLFEGTVGWGFYARRQVFMVAFEPPDPVAFQGASRPDWILDLSDLVEMWTSERPLAIVATASALARLQRALGHLPAPLASDGKFSLLLVPPRGVRP